MFGPALIPAAGESVRMGRPKLLLPLGGAPIIEHVVNAATLGGAAAAVVVVRPDDVELAAAASRAGAQVVRLRAPTPDMRATVLAGLDWIERYFAAKDRPGFFLVPADHPALSASVYRGLEDEIRRAGGVSPPRDGDSRDDDVLGHGTLSLGGLTPPARRASIVVPTYAGRRGHPVWIAWSHVAAMRATPSGQGLNEYLRTQSAETREIPWPTLEVLVDLDTPSDYDALQRTFGPTLITAAGESFVNPMHRPAAVLPGSFNPTHAGHWGLAAAAREMLGVEVSFEISRRNVDKPELTDAQIASRAAQFLGRADVWVTRAPWFVEKAECFPGATFVVGADTAVRLVDVRYYDGDAERLAAALDRLCERGCRFLVAGRTDRGRLLALEDIAIPDRWRPSFAAIPVSLFRFDVSSTELRREDR